MLESPRLIGATAFLEDSKQREMLPLHCSAPSNPSRMLFSLPAQEMQIDARHGRDMGTALGASVRRSAQVVAAGHATSGFLPLKPTRERARRDPLEGGRAEYDDEPDEQIHRLAL